eukprot:TRINITY_DN87690_c0_g1_i1.p2 TRINITY_DN87690_c0_g1~~TRINITY_DN87690_c0_g1_i1.p2  ORF type:complete len:159 (+),score=26.61 TRINITY_DN87690_c0_g1_i1:110-586(+)
MNNQSWLELCMKERKWNAIDMKENREQGLFPRPRSTPALKKYYHSIPKSPIAGEFESYIAPPPNRMIPVTDGSVAPKPSPGKKSYGPDYVFALSNPMMKYKYWPSDMSRRRLKPNETAQLAKQQEAAASSRAAMIPPRTQRRTEPMPPPPLLSASSTK